MEDAGGLQFNIRCIVENGVYQSGQLTEGCRGPPSYVLLSLNDLCCDGMVRPACPSNCELLAIPNARIDVLNWPFSLESHMAGASLMIDPWGPCSLSGVYIWIF